MSENLTTGRALYEMSGEIIIPWDRLPSDAKDAWEDNARRYDEAIRKQVGSNNG